MANLIKDKNYLVFTNDSGNTYKFDIATGVFYSTRGLPLKTCPSGFASYIQNEPHKTVLLRYMFCKHHLEGVPYTKFTPFAELMGICDRLDSIGYTVRSCFDSEATLLRFVDKNFKAFVKAFKNDNELSLKQFRTDYGKAAMMQELGIKIDNYYTENIVDRLWSMSDEFTTSELKLIAHYLSRGVYVFCGNLHNFSTMFKNFFEWCKVIGHTPTKDDFFKQYVLVKKNYLAQKVEYDNRKIVDHLAKHSHVWEFESDEFCIVVPQSSEDFKKEADSQQNCVYNVYLDSVIDGKTNVVFVRRKSEPEKSFITCEVDNNGKICQYLYKYNKCVDDNSAEGEFKKNLVEFIRANW